MWSIVTIQKVTFILLFFIEKNWLYVLEIHETSNKISYQKHRGRHSRRGKPPDAMGLCYADTSLPDLLHGGGSITA